MSARDPRPFVVYTFETTHEALAAEKVIESAGLQVTPIPTPKKIAALCGIAMRVVPEDAERAEGAMVTLGVRWVNRAEIVDV